MDKNGKIYTREDIVKALDANIDQNIKKWGENYIYTKWARERKDNILAKFDAGEVVMVEKEHYHEGGMDFEREFYSDGSTSDICYGYMD